VEKAYFEIAAAIEYPLVKQLFALLFKRCDSQIQFILPPGKRFIVFQGLFRPFRLFSSHSLGLNQLPAEQGYIVSRKRRLTVNRVIEFCQRGADLFFLLRNGTLRKIQDSEKG